MNTKRYGQCLSCGGKNSAYNSMFCNTCDEYLCLNCYGAQGPCPGCNTRNAIAGENGPMEKRVASDWATTQSSSSGGCFIATATYGSPLAPEVMVFRRFRDETLLSSPIGIAVVNFYYAISPPLAALIVKSNFLRTATRKLLLEPVLRWLTHLTLFLLLLIGPHSSVNARSFVSPVASEQIRPAQVDTLPSAQVEAVREHFEVGNEMAEYISTATSIPISPLLIVSGLGLYKYFSTPPENRHGLPWFASPYLWVPGLAIVLLFAFNSAIGSAVPVLKKPMDVVEMYENKVSMVLASPVIVSGAVSVCSRLAIAGDSAVAPHHNLAMTGMFAFNASPEVIFFGSAVVAPVFVLVSFVCWMAFHAINVLILLSPSGVVDMLLRGFKVGVLVIIVASTWIHPYLGALVSVAILLLACLIAGWSFRLTVFGSVFSWDLLTFRRKRVDTSSESVWVFSAGKIGKIPIRTYGKLNCDLSGRLHFHYRPLLLFPWRSVRLPIGAYGLRKGAISPVIV